MVGLEGLRKNLKRRIGGDGGYKVLHFLSRNIIASTAVRIYCGDNLSKLASINNTDKYKAQGHNYTEHYSFHFRNCKTEKIHILEIGIGGYKRPDRGGCSLRMWKHYFNKAHIYGIDIYDKSDHNENRITTFIGSQIDPIFLDSVIKKMSNSIDIIIDDGSHINSHVIDSFNLLFPKLNTGGIYVIEDTETSYNIEYGGNNTDLVSSPTIINYFKQVPDSINIDFIRNDQIFLNPVFKNIGSIHFYKGIIFIHKK